jgi:hypothetical protein
MGKPDFTGESIQQAMKMAQSSAGQQLIKLLQANGGQELRIAMEQAAAGDYTNAQKAISCLMQNPEARKLLDQLGGIK